MKVLVVDDEPLARRRLLAMLRRIPRVRSVTEASNGREALARAAELSPDCVLLDISMPGLDGLEVARSMGDVPVIFTTAHDEHAVEAFELAAIDYLLKPVRQERLERALEKLRERQGSGEPEQLRRLLGRLLEPGRAAPRRITARCGDSVHVFDPRQISHFSASRGYTAFSSEGREFLLDESLQQLEAQLAPLGFLRVHRSELVRIDAVRALHGEAGATEVELDDGQRAPVSRRLVPELKRRLGIP